MEGEEIVSSFTKHVVENRYEKLKNEEGKKEYQPIARTNLKWFEKAVNSEIEKDEKLENSRLPTYNKSLLAESKHYNFTKINSDIVYWIEHYFSEILDKKVKQYKENAIYNIGYLIIAELNTRNTTWIPSIIADSQNKQLYKELFEIYNNSASSMIDLQKRELDI